MPGSARQCWRGTTPDGASPSLPGLRRWPSVNIGAALGRAAWGLGDGDWLLLAGDPTRSSGSGTRGASWGLIDRRFGLRDRLRRAARRVDVVL